MTVKRGDTLVASTGHLHIVCEVDDTTVRLRPPLKSGNPVVQRVVLDEMLKKRKISVRSAS